MGVRRDRREWRESTCREPSSPPIAGDIRCRPRLTEPAVRGRWRRCPRLTEPAVHGRWRRCPRLTEPAVRGRWHPSPPARRCLKPAGSQLTQARRSRKITAPSAAHLARRSREITPPARRWLKPAGPPLTLAPWIQSTRHGQECQECRVLSCPQEHFNYCVLSMASWAPSSALASWAPCTAMVPVCLFCSGGPHPVFLSVSVLRGLQSSHPPSPVELLRLGRGELCQSSVVCVMCSHLLCPYLVCFLSLLSVIIS